MVTQLSELCYENATPALGHVGESEEECLRAAWERLGVGKHGFLDKGELALVCECIGMEKVAEEVSVCFIRCFGGFIILIECGTSSIL
jgi:hypothetical protein